jgi:hypothetical protein
MAAIILVFAAVHGASLRTREQSTQNTQQARTLLLACQEERRSTWRALKIYLWYHQDGSMYFF